MTDAPDDGTALARSMADVARALQHTTTRRQAWQEIVERAVDTLDGVDHAGITVVRRGRPETPSASSQIPVAVDRLQYETRQGPCLDAIFDHRSFRTGDLAAERERWPDFGPRAAAETGVRSMAVVRLFVGPDTLGSLNFYGEPVDAFDDDTVAAAAVFAAHSALAVDRVDQHTKVANLERALESSRQIGAAVGILMAHHRITEQQAFDLLKTASQNSNRKLREVADDVLLQGVLPVGPTRPA